MQIEQFRGTVFRTETGDEYGSLRRLPDHIPDDLRALQVTPLAYDDYGNYFVVKSDQVFFWDHETGDLLWLANSIAEFIAGLVVPEPVELKPGQVRSVWVNPDFLKKLKGGSEPGGP